LAIVAVMIEALHRLPTNVGMALQSLREAIKNIASKLFTMGPGGKVVEHLFVLGKGIFISSLII